MHVQDCNKMVSGIICTQLNVRSVIWWGLNKTATNPLGDRAGALWEGCTHLIDDGVGTQMKLNRSETFISPAIASSLLVQLLGGLEQCEEGSNNSSWASNQ